ncbi:hypothetical protein TcWFU_006396 [Taenia crassiceps]|uniref:Uncharacterized protein n=1 Tax=Taenia crassiceps TaxID=6207 RepID=A0ABR4QHY8_9CEST
MAVRYEFFCCVRNLQAFAESTGRLVEVWYGREWAILNQCEQGRTEINAARPACLQPIAKHKEYSSGPHPNNA